MCQCDTSTLWPRGSDTVTMNNVSLWHPFLFGFFFSFASRHTRRHFPSSVCLMTHEGGRSSGVNWNFDKSRTWLSEKWLSYLSRPRGALLVLFTGKHEHTHTQIHAHLSPTRASCPGIILSSHQSKLESLNDTKPVRATGRLHPWHPSRDERYKTVLQRDSLSSLCVWGSHTEAHKEPIR